jgi:excisionase family DNA binding protein
MTTKDTRAEAEIDAAMPSRNSQEIGRLLLRPEEAADAIGLSRARFYELLASKQIKSIKIGRSRRVPISELQSWIAAELADQTA